MFWRVIDRLAGSDPRADFEHAIRARIAFSFTVVLAATSGINALVLLFSGTARPGMVELGFAGCGLATGLAFLLIKTHRPNLVLALCAVFAAGIFAMSAWGNRGAFPPAAAYVPVILLGLYLAWGWRAAVVSLPVLVAFYGGVLVLGRRYAEAGIAIEPTGNLGLVVAAAALSAVWILFFGSFIRAANIDAAARLRQQNVDLEALVQKAEAASRAKTEFLANMGHELRTPLNGVLGMTNVLLTEADLADAHRRRVELINESGETLLGLLNDILDLSQIDTNTLVLEAVDFDLQEVLETLAETWRARISAKGLDFVLTLDTFPQRRVRGDPGRLRQILDNLLSNAVKFTAKGEIIIRVSQHGEGPLCRTEISVSDTGIGIAPDKLATIFDSFSQVDTSIKRRYGGTGLGLAISHQLAGMMGGGLELNSQLGRGSVFTLTISTPAAQSEEPVENTPTADTGSPIFLDEPLRILLVDDVATNLLVLNALVKQCFTGAELMIDTAAGGREAINLASATVYDLVLMDIQMPEMDGVTAMRCIRESRRGAAARIIAVTALASDDFRRALAAEGFAGFIAKPVNAGELRSALKASLGSVPPDQAAVS